MSETGAGGARVTRLAHLCLRASDLERSLHFYGTVLGLKRTFTFTRQGKVIGAYFEAGPGNFLEIFGAGEKDVPGPAHLCLETGDLEALRARLSDAGVESSAKTKGCDRSWQSWIKDPDGVAIEFHEYTDQSAQKTGRDVEVDW